MARPDLEPVRAELSNIPWGPIRYNRWTTGRTVHAKVVNDLQYHGIKQGYQVFPEFSADPDDSENDYRINVGWFDREQYEPVAAFEVCGGVPQHSIKKLRMLPDDVVKVIVSKSPNSTYIKDNAESNLPEDFEHIDAEVWKSHKK